MGKRTDPNDLINKVFKTLSENDIKVLNYQHKEKANYLYEVEFIETKNKYLVNRKQIINGKVKDLIRIKQLKRIEIEKQLKERTKITKKAKETLVIPNLKNKSVLSVDLASYSTGITVMLKNGKIKTTTISDDNGEFRIRSVNIIKKIDEIIKHCKIDVCIVEGQFLGLNSDVLKKLSQIYGMLQYCLLNNNVEYYEVQPNVWKHYFNFPTTRNEQKEFSKILYKNWTGEEPANDDEADSFCLLKFMIDKQENLQLGEI
ncbi:MAG: hypothetical protein ACRCXY_00875 [Fusobacteriaceae bacterium]